MPKSRSIPRPGIRVGEGKRIFPLSTSAGERRDFGRNPLPVHYDRGTNYFILVSGEIVLSVRREQMVVQGPTAILIDSDCRFGITQTRRENVNILVWVWKDRFRNIYNEGETTLHLPPAVQRRG